MPEDEERDHIRRTVATIRDICGAPPLGWYTGRYSPNTRRLVMEETETLCDSDSYNDDLPYWVQVDGKPRLIVLCSRHQRLQIRHQPGVNVRGGFLHLC
jgi:allantoinase